MSGAATTTTTAPSARLHRPPPAAQVHTRLARALLVTLTGELLADAQVRIEPCTQRAAISVYLAQHGSSELAVRATLWFLGEGPEAAFEATTRAAALRTGRHVLVKGEGLRMRWEHGDAIIAVGHTVVVELLEVQP